MTGMPPQNFDPLRFCAPRSVAEHERRRWVETAAYFRAQRRGFEPGHESEDWHEAELEIENRIVVWY